MNVEEYKTIITMAIGNEIAAYEFYKGVAEVSGDSILKAIFKDLAEEEKKHKVVLESFMSNPKVINFHDSIDYSVSKTVDKPTLSIEMKPVDAIALAMKDEEEAMNMYQMLATASKDQGQKDMFEALARMEKGHKVKLEETFTNMAFPEAW